MVDLHLLLFISILYMIIRNSCFILTYYRLREIILVVFSEFTEVFSCLGAKLLRWKWRVDWIHSFLFAVHSLSSKREFNAFKSRSILALSVVYLTLIPFNRTRIYPVFSIYTICMILEHFEDLSNRMNLGKYCAYSLKNLKSFEFILISLLNCDRF